MVKLALSVFLVAVLTGCLPPAKPLEFSVNGAAFSFSKVGSKFPSIAISPDNRYLAAEVAGKPFAPQATFVLWDLSAAALASARVEKTSDILSTTNVVSFSPDGKRLLAGGSYGLVSFAVPSLDDRQLLDERNVKDLAWTPDGEKYLSIGQTVGALGDGPLCTLVKGWKDHNIDKKLGDCQEPMDYVNPAAHVAVSPDGRYALSTRPCDLFLSDMVTGELLENHSFNSGKKIKNSIEPDCSDKVSDIEFSQDSNYFAMKSNMYQGYVNFYKYTGKSNELINLFGTDSFLTIKTVDTGNGTTTWARNKYKTTFESINNFTPKFTSDIYINNNKIIIYNKKGYLELFDNLNKYSIAKIVYFDDTEWVVITNNGYYNSSAYGDKYLTVVVNGELYPYDKLRETFHRPDIVKNIITAAWRGISSN